MRLASVPRSVCLLASAICLGAAYMLAGYSVIWLALVVMVLFWIAARRSSRFWSASSLLAVYVLLAIVGVVLKAPTLLLSTGCIFALACWDLNDSDEGLEIDVSPGARALMERHRLQSVALMVGISLLLAALSIWSRLQLPFGIIVLLILLAAGLILYSVHRLDDSSGVLGQHD